MATTFIDYDIQIQVTPSIDPPPQAPALVQIQIIHERKLQLPTPQGNVDIHYPFAVLEFQNFFPVPHHFFASFTLFDHYVFDRLSHMGISPHLCIFLKQHIVDSTCDAAHRNLNTDGIQIIAQLKMTSRVVLFSAEEMYDHILSFLGAETVIMEDGGGSVPMTRGASKAAIDGLKKKVLFFNGGGGGEDEGLGTCAVCLEDFGEGTEVAYMPCSHVFHHKCIVPWLKANNSCPMCRCVVPDQ